MDYADTEHMIEETSDEARRTLARMQGRRPLETHPEHEMYREWIPVD